MRRIGKAVSRKDFLRLGGAGLAGAALLGTAGCGGGSQGDVVRFLTGTAETTSQEREQENLVTMFEEKYPRYDMEREAIPGEDMRTVLKTRLQGGEPPDVFTYGTGPGFGGCWPTSAS